MRVPAPLRRSASSVRDLALLVVPHGGQHRARQNAWAGMSADAAVGRERRAAEVALSTALRRAEAAARARAGTGG